MAGFPTDSHNCNGCGINCTGGPVSRQHVMNTCPAGQADCDSLPNTVNTNTDASNCGGCGLACSPAHATGSCTGGTCGIGTCAPGFSDCDGLPGNGCEYDNAGFPTDPNNCGSCGAVCAPAHGSGHCAAGTCKITGCAPGFSDCDGLPANGCEYDDTGFPSDPKHCGGCGTACAAAHATPLCTAGACKMGACDADYVDVDGKPANGCECHKISTTDGTCDGVDDDCNGLIDDGYIGTACGTGACASKSRCVNGNFSPCTPGRPAAEGPASDPTCADGVDNSCDGLTDDADSNCAASDGGSGPGDAGTNPDASTTDGGNTDDGSSGRDLRRPPTVTGAGGSTTGGSGGSGGSTSVERVEPRARVRVGVPARARAEVPARARAAAPARARAATPAPLRRVQRRGSKVAADAVSERAVDRHGRQASASSGWAWCWPAWLVGERREPRRGAIGSDRSSSWRSQRPLRPFERRVEPVVAQEGAFDHELGGKMPCACAFGPSASLLDLPARFLL
jgi:hypothetical protein